MYGIYAACSKRHVLNKLYEVVFSVSLEVGVSVTHDFGMCELCVFGLH